MSTDDATLSVPPPGSAAPSGTPATSTPGLIEVTERGARLDQLLLVGTLALVLTLVVLLGVAQVVAITWDYETQSREQTARVQTQTKESGAAVTRVVALTAASAVRQNDYAFLGALATAVTKDDPSVLRVQIYDRDGRMMADSKSADAQGEARHFTDARVTTAAYEGHPVFEYQEAIEYPGQGKGLVILTYSLDRLQQELLRLDQGKRDAVRRTTLRTAGLGALFVCIAAALSVFQSRKIAKPIAALTKGAAQFSRGDFTARVPVAESAGREVRTLGRVFNDMGEKMVRLLRDAGTRAVQEQQIQVGRALQETVVPGPAPFELGPLRVAGALQGAAHFGGDWWMRLALDDRRVVIALGDVGGQGLSGGLVATSALSGLMAVTRTLRPEQVHADFLMQALHQTVLSVGQGNYRMTCALAVFDVGTGELELALAGHPPPCILSRNDGRVAPAAPQGAKVGAQPFSCKATRMRLPPGSLIVLASDGVLTTRDPEQTDYGWERLKNVALQHAKQPAESVRDTLFADVAAFRGAGQQKDDLTIVVAELTEKGHR